MDRLSEEESTALLDGEADPYSTDDLGITWAAKEHHLLALDNGLVVAHAGWLPVEFESETGARLPGAGLGSVMVRHDRRGHGLGVTLIREAADGMRDLGRPFGFLFCRPVRLAFYQRNGWQGVTDEVVVDQPDGPLVMPLHTCWTALAPDAVLPPGRLRLASLPF